MCNKWFASLRHHTPRCGNHADYHDSSESSDDSSEEALTSRKAGKVESSKKHFQCVECVKEFRSRALLQAHMKTDHPALKCMVSDEVFGSDDDLQQHMLAHSNKNQLKCEICKKTFQSSRIFAAHVREHENGKLSEPVAEELVPNECVVCRKSFADFLQLNQHVKKHNVNGGFDCAMCNEAFPFYHLLSRHVMEEQHWRPKTGFPCSVCDEELPDENALQLHLFTHHDAELTVKCYLCAERFTCNGDLDVHIAAAHAMANVDDFEMEMDEEVGRECYRELMAGLTDDSNEY
ncbi:zinc finger protein 26-like [Paramacrobiotus metropolitanus]|uniref:zinc finger protein 26-like n=1 Tax=Paramacrobiotus metropolitanus TaxID=2943436 RepID=UPI002445A9E5|nr:zinc finger protein 26-like [Paramacrobiotus metropolitanus]